MMARAIQWLLVVIYAIEGRLERRFALLIAGRDLVFSNCASCYASGPWRANIRPVRYGVIVDGLCNQHLDGYCVAISVRQAARLITWIGPRRVAR